MVITFMLGRRRYFPRLATTTDYNTQISAITTTFNAAEMTGTKKMSLSFVPEYWDKAEQAVANNASSVGGGVDY